MTLAELIIDLPVARLVPPQAGALHVGAVCDDSRQVRPGDVFVAARGRTVDGHHFVSAAVTHGAAAVVVEHEVPGLAVPQVVVPHGAQALGWLAARAAARPSDRLGMIGITGTNGKTTTSFVLESILAAAGQSPGVIGTVSYRYAGKTIDAPYTTPTAIQLHALLGDMVRANCTHAVMETSSIAIDMERLAGTRFQVGAFTNLTQDHLDVHGTMAAYFAAKARLFAELIAPGGAACAMIDDAGGHGEAMLGHAPPGVRRLRVSATSRADADVAVMTADSSIAGVRAELRTPRGSLTVRSAGLLGTYNVANLALAVAVSEALELPHEAIARGIERLPGVPGRVERVPNARGLDVFVDYAHTPDALARVIAALRPLTLGRLIVVFGCGGDRDPGKRPQMGRIAAEGADLAVVTSDNPRTEDPARIIGGILDGMRGVATMEEPIVDVDRRVAIAAAVHAAEPGRDVVLIAGKGHEDYQILGTTKIHFDDREEAAAAIEALGT